MKIGSVQDHPLSGVIVAAIFAFFVAFLGGTARLDQMQVLLLLPIAAFFLVPVAILSRRTVLTDIRAPLFFVMAFALLMAVQLIPLPHGVWSNLSGRTPVAEMDGLLGMGELWRPLSMVPSRTLGALFGLLVPLVAILLVGAGRLRGAQIVALLLGIGALDASIVLLQALAGSPDALYFYAITNTGSPVGIFANQNHSAVFSSAMALLAAYAITSSTGLANGKLVRIGYGFIAIICIFAGLIGGSRAGFMTTILAILAAAVMLYLARPVPAAGHRRRKARFTLPQIRPAFAVAGFGVILLGIGAVFFSLDRATLLASIGGEEAFEDLRFTIFPTLVEMARTFWLTGAGFGAFKDVYHIFETPELLFPFYVNNAHNDWLQFTIEAGLPGLLILAIALAWFVRKLVLRARLVAGVSVGGGAGVEVVFWVSCVAIFAFASLVDYPVRTPLFQYLLVMLAALLAGDPLAMPAPAERRRR